MPGDAIFPVKAIVFDMDGVLVDSASGHNRAFAEIFTSFGIRNFVYADYAGQRTADVIATVLGSAGIGTDPAMIAELSATKTRLAQASFRTENPVTPGCLTVLRRLAAVFPIALASSGSRSSVQLFLEINECAALFSSVLTGADVVHAKPHPEIYLRSFDVLGVRAADAVVIEDAVSGVLAAKAAGAGSVIGVAGTCGPEALLHAGADRIVRELNDLPAILIPALITSAT